MRKPIDFDSELKALDERARQLRTRKLQQLGELVVSTGADALPIDILAGALLSAARVENTLQEDWRICGAAFFQQTKRKQRCADSSAGGAPTSGGGAMPFTGGAGPQ